jgi:hypothetical protein
MGYSSKLTFIKRRHMNAKEVHKQMLKLKEIQIKATITP